MVDLFEQIRATRESVFSGTGAHIYFEWKILHYVLVSSLLRQPIRRQDRVFHLCKMFNSKTKYNPKKYYGQDLNKTYVWVKNCRKIHTSRTKQRFFFYFLITKLLFLIRGTIFVALKKYSSPEISDCPCFNIYNHKNSQLVLNRVNLLSKHKAYFN